MDRLNASDGLFRGLNNKYLIVIIYEGRGFGCGSRI